MFGFLKMESALSLHLSSLVYGNIFQFLFLNPRQSKKNPFLIAQNYYFLFDNFCIFTKLFP